MEYCNRLINNENCLASLVTIFHTEKRILRGPAYGFNLINLSYLQVRAEQGGNSSKKI